MAVQIKPSPKLSTFIQSIPTSTDMPAGLLNFQENKDEEGFIANGDLHWIRNYIQQVSREKIYIIFKICI